MKRLISLLCWLLEREQHLEESKKRMNGTYGNIDSQHNE